MSEEQLQEKQGALYSFSQALASAQASADSLVDAYNSCTNITREDLPRLIGTAYHTTLLFSALSGAFLASQYLAPYFMPASHILGNSTAINLTKQFVGGAVSTYCNTLSTSPMSALNILMLNSFGIEEMRNNTISKLCANSSNALVIGPIKSVYHAGNSAYFCLEGVFKATGNTVKYCEQSLLKPLCNILYYATINTVKSGYYAAELLSSCAKGMAKVAKQVKTKCYDESSFSSNFSWDALPDTISNTIESCHDVMKTLYNHTTGNIYLDNDSSDQHLVGEGVAITEIPIT